jgi:myo-inositol-hexaphosphate 3-phosphohydrolase
MSYDIRTQTLHNATLLNWPDNYYFHPHGLALYRDENNDIFIYVVNHRRTGGDSVEIFRVKDAQTLYVLFHLIESLSFNTSS